jgi:hypothetical protein
MLEATSIFLPSPLVGEGGAERSSATGEGYLTVQRVLRECPPGRSDAVATHHCSSSARSGTLGDQGSLSRLVTFGRSVLTTVDFNDQALFEANEIENIALKRHLPPELETLQPSIAQQSPHRRFGIGRFVAHLLCETADAPCGRTMAWWLRHVPLTRR